jgi:hypothetical protein
MKLLINACLVFLSATAGYAQSKARPAKPKSQSAKPNVAGTAAASKKAQALPEKSLPPSAEVTKAPITTAKMAFETLRPWTAGRWYVVGQWVSADRIEWLGSKGGTRMQSKNKCFTSQGKDAKIFRNKDVDPSLAQAEILSSESWVAIEVSPSVQAEEFNLDTGRADCPVKFSVSYQWTKGGGQLQPLLFLQPSGNRFYGFDIAINQTDLDSASQSDIQMDLLMGVWSAKFPNASSSANQSLTMVPTAVARGEWLPMKKHWGLQLALEQTVANFGGVSGQSALYSDWTVGTFGEYFLPALDAIQLRGSLKLHQHLGDDSSNVPTIASPNKRAQNLIIGFTSNFYFAQRWMFGLDVDYAPNLKLAGRGVKQGLLGTQARAGYRVNNFMSILVEGGYRAYKAVGYSNESLTMVQAGIRIEL